VLTLCFLLSNFLLTLLSTSTQAVQAAPSPSFYLSATPTSEPKAIAPPDFFGVVGRDPWYDFNSDPTNPGRPNLALEEHFAQEISMMGARWIRIEFHAENRADKRGGYIDFSKYDPFIKEIAPRYGLKVVALLGGDLVLNQNAGDKDLHYTHLNDPSDLYDGSNPYIRFFAGRVREIADYYGDQVAAYEILNEPNSWYGFKADPEKVGTVMTLSYAHTKPSHPTIKLILGATIATGDPRLDHVLYLRGIYQSKAVQTFKQSGTHFEDNPFPFDGVAWHPYFPSAWDALYTVDQAKNLMRQMGDTHNKLWITETGLFGTKNNNNCGSGIASGREDEEQAQYLKIFYTQAALKQQDIATVFWFKFEDFYVNNQLVPMGLVHLAADDKLNYNPYFGKIVRYKPAYLSYQTLAAPNLPKAAVAAPAIQWSATNPTAPYYFSQTGHTLSGPFLNYWLKYGGTDLFGLPLTEPYKELDSGSGKIYMVQWFERERFEYHPENAGTNYEVLLGLLGNELLAKGCRTFDRAQTLVPTATPIPTKPGPTPIPTPPDRIYFKETGHNLVGTFKTYWEKRGGLAIFGYPISEEFGETNLADGHFYVVQYFERARFEYHPEHKGTPYEVELGLLGSPAIAERFGY